MKTIFIVDDNDVNLSTAEKALSKQYRAFTLPSASDMFELLKDIVPDLILLDILMPQMDGFEAMRLLKDDGRYHEIPVMFLTSRRDAATEARGFEMGAVDFISKPFSEPVLLNRIRTHLEIEGLIRERTAMLQQRTDKLQRLQNSMVSILANMVENRDKYTGRHIERTTKYMKILLYAMLERGVYPDEIAHWNFEEVVSSVRLYNIGEILIANEADPYNLETVISSARLHDIGKITISDLILNKPGKLTEEEYELMKSHASEGEKIIDSIITESGNETFLQNAKLFAGCHHEKWDGTGYPRGLKGTDIPLQGRIMAVVDVYDALISDRSYKSGFTHEKAVEIIKESSGSHFDPKIVDVFLDVSDLFKDT
ncbi:MAG: response regulator [Treponema sp.]|nr:response regulator [Treponema sp.]